jgi:hypothetical protein
MKKIRVCIVACFGSLSAPRSRHQQTAFATSYERGSSAMTRASDLRILPSIDTRLYDMQIAAIAASGKSIVLIMS